MARQRKVVQAKDYDLLIKESEEKIEKLTQNLKSEKVNLKSLKKSKELYEIQNDEQNCTINCGIRKVA